MLNTANILTLSRIVAIPLVVACQWLDRPWSPWVAVFLFVAIPGVGLAAWWGVLDAGEREILGARLVARRSWAGVLRRPL